MTNAARDRPLYVGPALPPLGVHVADVVELRPKEQVLKPHAPRVVAAVADENVGRECPVNHLPGEPMGVDGSSRSTRRTSLELAVAERLPSPSGPLPATIAGVLLDLLPEPILYGTAARRHTLIVPEGCDSARR